VALMPRRQVGAATLYIEHVINLLARRAHAPAMTSCHVCIAEARNHDGVHIRRKWKLLFDFGAAASNA
jgi:hypothetical protein